MSPQLFILPKAHSQVYVIDAHCILLYALHFLILLNITYYNITESLHLHNEHNSSLWCSTVLFVKTMIHYANSRHRIYYITLLLIYCFLLE